MTKLECWNIEALKPRVQAPQISRRVSSKPKRLQVKKHRVPVHALKIVHHWPYRPEQDSEFPEALTRIWKSFQCTRARRKYSHMRPWALGLGECSLTFDALKAPLADDKIIPSRTHSEQWALHDRPHLIVEMQLYRDSDHRGFSFLNLKKYVADTALPRYCSASSTMYSMNGWKNKNR